MTQFLDNMLNNIIPQAITDSINNVLPNAINNEINNVLPIAINNVLPIAINNMLPNAINNAINDVLPIAINNVLPNAINNEINIVLPIAINNMLPIAINNVLPNAINNAINDVLPIAINNEINNVLPIAINNALPIAINNTLPLAMVPFENNQIKMYNYLTKVSNVPCNPLKSTGPPNLNWQTAVLILGGNPPTPAPIGSLPSNFGIYFPQYAHGFDTMTNAQCNDLISFYGLANPQSNLSFGNNDGNVILALKRSTLKLFVCGH
jgi:hypothetical protein